MDNQVELTEEEHLKLENDVATYLRNGLALYSGMRPEVRPSHVIIGLCKVLLHRIVLPLEAKDRKEGLKVVKVWLDESFEQLEANPAFQASVARQKAEEEAAKQAG